MAGHSKIDLEQLRIEIRAMHQRKKLFQVLREELSAINRWRVKPRGNPRKGYQAMLKKRQDSSS
jgi:hypothetical protein